MPTDARPNIFPVFRYQDPAKAIDWLKDAFGFEPHVDYRDDDGNVQHAELRLGAGLIMVGGPRPAGWLGGGSPDPLASTVSAYLIVPDPDALYERAKAAGATIVRELTDEDYGSREFSARDLEGNLFSFGTYDPLAPQG